MSINHLANFDLNQVNTQDVTNANANKLSQQVADQQATTTFLDILGQQTAEGEIPLAETVKPQGEQALAEEALKEQAIPEGEIFKKLASNKTIKLAKVDHPHKQVSLPKEITELKPKKVSLLNQGFSSEQAAPIESLQQETTPVQEEGFQKNKFDEIRTSGEPAPRIFNQDISRGVEEALGPQEQLQVRSDKNIHDILLEKAPEISQVKAESFTPKEARAFQDVPPLKELTQKTNVMSDTKNIKEQALPLEEDIVFKPQQNNKVALKSFQAHDTKQPSLIKNNLFEKQAIASQGEKGIVEELKIKEPKTLKDFLSESPRSLDYFENGNNEPLVSESKAGSKLDLSQIDTKNTEKIISEIKDHILQIKTANEPTVNLKVQHNDLGHFDITVNKSSSEMININIESFSKEALDFFSTNKSDLISSLTQSGLNLGELKLESGGSKNNSSFSQSFANQQGSQGQYQSDNNQRQQESERRQNLWDLLRDKEAA